MKRKVHNSSIDKSDSIYKKPKQAFYATFHFLSFYRWPSLCCWWWTSMLWYWICGWKFRTRWVCFHFPLLILRWWIWILLFIKVPFFSFHIFCRGFLRPTKPVPGDIGYSLHAHQVKLSHPTTNEVKIKHKNNYYFSSIECIHICMNTSSIFVNRKCEQRWSYKFMISDGGDFGWGKSCVAFYSFFQSLLRLRYFLIFLWWLLWLYNEQLLFSEIYFI